MVDVAVKAIIREFIATGYIVVGKTLIYTPTSQQLAEAIRQRYDGFTQFDTRLLDWQEVKPA